MDEKRTEREVKNFFEKNWDTLKNDVFLIVKTKAHIMEIENAYGELVKKEFKPSINFPDFTPYICTAYNKTGYNMYISKDRFKDISDEDIFLKAYENTESIEYELNTLSGNMAVIQHQFSSGHFLYNPKQISQILLENNIQLPTIIGIPSVYDISVLINNEVDKNIKNGIDCQDLLSYNQFTYEEQPHFFVTPECYYINKQGEIKNVFETKDGLIVYDPKKNA